MKVVICDNLEKEGIELFAGESQVKADVYESMSPQQLKDIIPLYEGIIVRSATTLTADILELARRLKVIGRAGTGLDNIDVQAASKRGIVVMNTPGANAITTAEHTISLMLALSRHIPQASASLKAGKWEKKKFMGIEIFNQTLGIIGLGNIGQIVADRARGLKMRVIAYDPFVPEEIMARKDVKKVTFEQLLEQSDYITIHTPLTDDTRNLLNRDTFKKMKRGVRIINCARGGLVNEQDLYEAILKGIVAGAALDVFEKEPPGLHPLLSLEEVIATPHLGASTYQAQANVARTIAQQVKDYLEKGIITHAVNVPSVSPEIMEQIRPYLILAEKMGRFMGQVISSDISEIRIEYSGEVTQFSLAPLTVAVIKSLLEPVLSETINYVNAPFLAKERGMTVREHKTEQTEGFSSLITVCLKSGEENYTVSGTLFGKNDPRIVRVNGFSIEAKPEGHLLYMHNYDRPGVIGSLGNILGENGINIATMHLSRQRKGEIALSLIQVDEPVPPQVLKRLAALPHITTVKHITL